MHDEPLAPAVWVTLGGALVCGATGIVRLAGDPIRQPAWALLAVATASAGIACALRATARPTARPERLAAIVLVVSAAARVALLTWHPGLSDDIYRYLWDGRVLLSGHNPYLASPAHPVFAPLRDPSWARINHPDLPTIYPPVAAAFSALAIAIGGPRVESLTAGVIVLDLALCGVLAFALARSGRSPAWSVLYAWNPLVLAEVGGSGHVDVVATLPLVVAVVLLAAAVPRRALAGTLLGVSILGKYGAILLVPLLARRLGPRGLAACAAVVILGLAPFVATAPHVFTSLFVYLRTWEFNGSVYAILASWTHDPLLARRVLGAVTVAAIGVIAIRAGRAPERLAAAAALTVLVVLLLAHTVHPWYLLWALPFAVLAQPSRPATWWLAAVFAWSVTVLLSYAVLSAYRATGTWRLAPPIQVAEYVPVYLLLAAHVARLRARA